MPGTEFCISKHAEDGDGLVHPSQYTPPPHLDEHIGLIQPATVLNRAEAQRTTYRSTDLDSDTAAPSQSSSAKITVPGSGLYNAVNYVPQAAYKNAIALTDHLE
ncbi:hypothetical protein EDB85DRAFT_2142388 [Lactarius pseudohatsudake]|nr:hypothetical protein EDB85DRAFT_2142388 [Lactarius pseudohatsudake]